MTEGRRCLGDLCNDSVTCFAAFLSLSERSVLMSTSKRYRNHLKKVMRLSLDLSMTEPPKVEKILCWASGNQVNGIRSIDLHGCPLDNISELLVNIIKRQGHLLQSINLAHCPAVDDDVISSLAKHAPNLTNITLFEAGKLGRECLHLLIKNCRHIESFDLRAQPAVNDATADLICEHLKTSLREILLVGTRVTVKGFVQISNTCPNLTKIGCIQLSGDTANVPPLASASLQDLQIAYCRSDMTVNFKQLPKLSFISCSCSVPMEFINWNDIGEHCTSLKQIMYIIDSGYGNSFLECLKKRADGLLHLSVGQFSDEHTGLLRSMVNLVQLRVNLVSAGVLQAAANLPKLQMLTLFGFASGFERIFTWLFCGIQNPFRSLTHLHVVLASEWEAVPVLLKACPKLRHLYFHPTLPPSNMKEIVESLPANQMETFTIADSLLLDDLREIVPLLKNMKHLTSLRLGRGPVPEDIILELVSNLPNLRILESQGYDFSSWTCHRSPDSDESRWLRHAPTKGFYEKDALKPSGGFLTLFKDVRDPIFGVDIP